MANIEKFATPINNRNISLPVKEQKTHDAEKTDFQNVSKVKGTLPDSEILKQNNKFIENQHGPAVFMNLLTDPKVTVGFMRSIMSMIDIVELLHMSSEAITKEMQQMFGEMILQPDEIADELVNQENASTAFKGPLFDFLRNLIGDGTDKDLKSAVIDVLKSVNSEKSSEDILRALSGSLEYLSNEMKPSRDLSNALMRLSGQFAEPDAAEIFSDIKHQVLDLMFDIENSVLYSERTSKLIAMIRYNISRFNLDPDFLTNSVNRLMTMLSDDEKSEFLQLLYDHLAIYESREREQFLSDSKVMNTITDILKMQSENKDIKEMNPDSVESIIHSILSSPGNFTPLLHFIIPVEYEDISSFAELWIDPDEKDEESGDRYPERCIHMYIAFDIDRLGKMEAEFIVRNKNIDLKLFCDPEVTDYISEYTKDIRKSVNNTDYKINEISIVPSSKTRSLVDIFEGLSIKRNGLNVKI